MNNEVYSGGHYDKNDLQILFNLLYLFLRYYKVAFTSKCINSKKKCDEKRTYECVIKLWT